MLLYNYFMRKYYVDVIADGVCCGNAVVLNLNTVDNNLKKSVIEEKNKLSLALQSAILDIEKIDNELANVHKMLLNDKILLDELFYEIEHNLKSAFESVSYIFDKYIEKFKSFDSVYLKERYLDLEDIKIRLQRVLTKQTKDFSNLKNVVLVIDELLPSLLLEVMPAGVICRKGGSTSHAAILCRSLGIACVVVPDIDVRSKDKVIIDSREKVVYINPDKELTNSVLQVDDFNYNFKLDNLDYKLLCNVSSLEEVEKCSSYDFDAVGLYRTEFIFMSSNHILTVEEQYEKYLAAVLLMKERPICFRTFDIGEDKQIPFIDIKYRGVNNYFNNPILFENQIKALIMANKFNNIKIMFPMIENSNEFDRLKSWVLDIQKEMKDTSTIQIGMMLETKQALNNIEDFVNADFISIGTNDLTAELYNISRDEMVSNLDYINDLIQCLKSVVYFCNKHNKSLSVCGELVANTDAAKGFINIGIKNYSVSLPNVKYIYYAIKECLKC